MSDNAGRALMEMTATAFPPKGGPPITARAGAPDPHLALAAPFLAGFEHEASTLIELREASAELLDDRRPPIVASALLPGSGSGRLGEGSTSGAVETAAHAIAWNLTWKPEESSTFLLPFEDPPFQVALRTPGSPVAGNLLVDGNRIDLAGGVATQTHGWGRGWPRSWALAVCADWDRIDLAPEIAHPADSPGDPELAILWANGGLFGMPVVKTFGHLRVGGRSVAFNRLHRAITASSAVVWPRWEARLLGEDVKLTALTEVDTDSLAQYELCDPGGRRVWRTVGARARIHVAIEREANGRWIPAGTLESDRCRIDFGGRSPYPGVVTWDSRTGI